MAVGSSNAELEELDRSIAAANRVLAEVGDETVVERQREVGAALVAKGDALREIFHHRAALTCAAEVITRSADSPDRVLQARVVSARRIQAVMLLALGQTERALTVAVDVVESVEQGGDGELRWELASALMVQAGALQKLKRPAETERVGERLSEEFTADPWQGPRHANMVAAGLLIKLEAVAAQARQHDAEQGLDEFIAHFSSAPAPSVQSLVVRATSLKAHIVERERAEEALALRQTMIDRFAKATRPGLRQSVERAAIAQANTLRKLERMQEAIDLLDQALSRLRDDPDPRVNPALEIRASGLKAVLVEQQGHTDEAVRVCEDCLTRFRLAPPPDVESELAQLARRQAEALDRLGERERAVAALDRVILCPEIEADRPGILAGALMQKVFVLERLGRDAEIIQTCQEIVRRFDHDPPPETPWVVLDALYRVSYALTRLGQRRRALAACEDILERFEHVPEDKPQAIVLSILYYKSQLLLAGGRSRKSLKLLDIVLERAGQSHQPELERLVGKAREAQTAIRIMRSDRRRLLIATVAPLGLLALVAAAAHGTLRASVRFVFKG